MGHSEDNDNFLYLPLFHWVSEYNCNGCGYNRFYNETTQHCRHTPFVSALCSLTLTESKDDDNSFYMR